MKTFIRLLLWCLIPIASTSASLAAETVHLYLKDAKGKIYKTKTNATGKFNFEGVEPGKYQLIWVLPDGASPENTESASIEIQSFSWGVSQMNHHGSSTSSNQRTSDPPAASQAPAGSSSKGEPSAPSGGPPSPGHTPPPGIQAGGGANDGAAARKTRSNIQNNFAPDDFQRLSDGTYYLVVMEEVLVSGVSTCEGTCSRMAINEKGVPGKKKSTTK